MSDLTPGSPEWVRRVSPSKVAAIVGASPWDSQRSMWHKMRGEVPWDSETPAMERGTLCEPAVLAWWRLHHGHTGWQEQFTQTLGDWCVATPDAVTVTDDGGTIVEAKTAASDDSWGSPSTDQVPTYYLAQAFFAAHVLNITGTPINTIHMPVLFGTRLRFENYVIAYDPVVGADLLARCEAWYASLSADTPPELDDSVTTFQSMRLLHPEIDRGTEVELTYDEALAFADALHDEEQSAARARHMRSTVLERMGRAQFAMHRGIKVARRQRRGDDAVTFVPLTKHPNQIPETETAV